MFASERHDSIIELLESTGRVSVTDLAARFDITPETVRRDLDLLEERGLARRVHGGAVAGAAPSRREVPLSERTERAKDAKARIVARALTALGPGFTGSIYLDAGSTTALLAASIASATDLTAEVVTHSMQIAATLSGTPGISLTAIGGRVRGLTAAAVGGDTVRRIEALRPDVAFIGTNGVSSDFGLSTPDPDEADVKSAVVGSGRRVVVLADAEKFETDLLVSFATLPQIDVLITDAAPPAALATALEAAGVEVWIA